MRNGVSKALLKSSNMTSTCPCPLFNIVVLSWMASTSWVSHDMPLRNPCCLEVMMSYLFKWLQICDTKMYSNILRVWVLVTPVYNFLGENVYLFVC